jgi:hypothetical protein
MEFVISRRTNRECVYFTVYWSHISKADKYDIVRKVPAMGGIAEMYFIDERGKLNLFCVTRSWYGGLRSTIRALSDPLIEKDPYRKGILLAHEKNIYYRYVLCESYADMTDIVFFFMETYSPGADAVEHSGRFSKIFLKEIDAEKIVTI